jgi:hypothetical protein
MLFGAPKMSAPQTGGTPKIAVHRTGAAGPFAVIPTPPQFAKKSQGFTGHQLVRDDKGQPRQRRPRGFYSDMF